MKERYECIIYGIGQAYEKFINLIKFEEHKGNINVVGFTSNDYLYEKLDGKPYIPLESVHKCKYDYMILISVNPYEDKMKLQKEYKIPKEKIILAEAFLMPMFDFDKYVSVIEQNISIISQNCWGSWVYHRLGLEFSSPFIKTWISEEDFWKMCIDLKEYMDQDVQLIKYEYNYNTQKMYPIGSLKDIEIHFFHEDTIEEALKKWNRRRERINYDNLMFVGFSEDRNTLDSYRKLETKKKYIFTTYDAEEEGAICLDYLYNRSGKKVTNFSRDVVGIGIGGYKNCDLLELISHNVYKKRIE